MVEVIMEKYIYNEQTGLHYELVGDYYYPCLTLPEPPCIGIWGQRRLQYLRTNKRVLYTTMLMSDTLKAHLEEVDKSAEEMFDQLTVQLKAQEGVTEHMKATNQMDWVQRMITIRDRVAEIVCKELIYV
jgi:hypothetical protein